MLSSRRNKEKLIDKILKRERILLKDPKEDYFQKYYGEQKVDKEESDKGVSDFRSDDEEEEEDLFDDDFNILESENESDLSLKNKKKKGQHLKKKNFAFIKNKKDRYFKKGFDINNLNFESLEILKKTKKKKIGKKKKKYIPVGQRFHFIHELFSQKELLKHCMFVERFNIYEFLENEKINDNQFYDENKLFEKKEKKNFIWKKNIFWNKDKNTVGNNIEFLKKENFNKYFKIEKNIPEKKDNSKNILDCKEYKNEYKKKVDKNLEEKTVFFNDLQSLLNNLEKSNKRKKKAKKKKKNIINKL